MNLTLLPLGDPASNVLDMLCIGVPRCFYSIFTTCKIQEEQDLPGDAYNPDRNQYDSSIVLNNIGHTPELPKSGKLLGVTQRDMYAGDLNFVFGQAQCPGSIAVISTHRLIDTDREGLFLERNLKEATHEIGHTFGLRHCSNQRCAMSFSNSILDVDRKLPLFCANCRNMLGLESKSNATCS